MIILAVLLLAAVAAVVVFVVVAGYDVSPVSMSWGALELDASPVWIFLLGVVTLLAAELALALLRGGSRRKLAKRRELKRLRDVEAHSGPPASGSAFGGAAMGGGQQPDRDRATAGPPAGSAGPGLTKPASRPGDATWHDEPRR